MLFSRMPKKYVLLQGQANVAQLAEHQLPKLRVAGSNPVIRSKTTLDSVCAGVVFCRAALFC